MFYKNIKIKNKILELTEKAVSEITKEPVQSNKNIVFVLNDLQPNESIENIIRDMDGKVYFGALGIADENSDICLENYFDVSPLINSVKDVTVLICQKTQDNRCVVVGCMLNAEIRRKFVSFDWQNCSQQIICDAENAFIVPKNKRNKFYNIKDYTFDNTAATKRYIKEICCEKNCVKFDSSALDKRLANAKDFKELQEISDKYDDNLQHKKSIAIWEKKYANHPDDSDVILMLAECSLECYKIKDAIRLFLKVFDKIKENDYYLSKLAVCYFLGEYNTEMKNILDLIEDRNYLKDWGYAYDYLMEYAPLVINWDEIAENKFIKHKIDVGFTRMPLPEVIKCGSEKKYYDPIRKKGIPITPEERVRQQVLRYLLDECKIPAENIVSEDSMAHYEKNAVTRADITVRSGNNTLLIVECKAPQITIDGDPIRQLFGYNEIMRSKYLCVTNGKDSYIFQKNKDGKYDAILTMPDFSVMLGGELPAAKFSAADLKRPGIAEINSKKVIDQYRNDGMYLGVNTKDSVAPYILNLLWMFFDTENKIENISGYGIKIKKDNGLIDTELTNVSGGSFPGTYRQFLVEDSDGNGVLVYYAVLGTYALSEKKGGYTSLVCGISRENAPVARLEMRLDVSIKECGGQFKVFHNGVRSRKRIQDTIDYVCSVCGELIEDNLVQLGTFKKDKLLYCSDKAVQDFMLRLTAYLIIRDDMSRKKL